LGSDRENLKLTVDQRLRKLAAVLRFLREWHGAARKAGRWFRGCAGA